MAQSSIKTFFSPLPPGTPKPTPKPLLTLQPMRKAPPIKRPVGRSRKRPIMEITSDEQVPAIPSQEDCVSSPSPVEQSVAKKVRASYTMKKKEEVVTYAKAHSIYQASQHFGLSTGTIGPWMKIDFSKLKATVFQTPGSGRKLTYPMEKEQELVQWVLEQRDLHLAVSVQSLMDKAAEIITPTVSGFMASRGWAQKFMCRNNIVIRAKTTVTQKLPAALEEKMTQFHAAVKEAIKRNQYPLELIGNMDETLMYFDMASNTTFEKKGTKSVSIRTTGAEKRHLTVVLAASADGSMLPLFVIFKGKRKLKNLSVPRGWVVTVQQKGWMDADLMKHWVQEIWLKYTSRRKALLLMDSFSAH